MAAAELRLRLATSTARFDEMKRAGATILKSSDLQPIQLVWQRDVLPRHPLCSPQEVACHRIEGGRGVRVGRGLGVGVVLGVGVGVGLGVGVGVPTLCTSNEPLSMRPLTTRAKPGPRWS